jgi:hypothetical protein
MTIDQDNCVFVATDEELTDIHYYLRVWLAARNIPIPRRHWLDEMADAFRDYNGTIFNTDGGVYDVPLVDDIFGDDPDMRWLSDYLRSDASGRAPYRFSPRLDRVRLIDLYLRIRHASIARHFNR